MISLDLVMSFREHRMVSLKFFSGQPIRLFVPPLYEIWPSPFVSDAGFRSSVNQLLETAWQVCFPVDRRAAGCMYGLYSRYSEFAVEFQFAVIPVPKSSLLHSSVFPLGGEFPVFREICIYSDSFIFHAIKYTRQNHVSIYMDTCMYLHTYIHTYIHTYMDSRLSSVKPVVKTKRIQRI